MAWIALNCPQCSAPLPRIAIWRSVKCPSCGALITRTESVVLRDTFRQALVRARRDSAFSGGDVRCCGERYQLMQLLGSGEISQVYAARRVGALPYLATIKLSSSPAAAARYAREALVLRELHVAASSGVGAYFPQLLPGIMADGVVEGGDHTQRALVLRHANGNWGSLAALNDRFAQGLDPRHAVWIWRRILGILSLIHALGWAHGDVRPEHALVHPEDHGVRLIGWALAKKSTSAKDQAMDLLRSARVVLVLLGGGTDVVPGHVPAGLAQLVNQASHDAEFCGAQGAEGLDALLRTQALAAFGPPAFVPLTI